MGGLDNAMTPPMDTVPNDAPLVGDDDNDMPQDFDDEPMDNENSDDNELMDIVNKLSVEDKAAVVKYAKSMADDSMNDEMPQGDEMPMESKKRRTDVIDEILNDVSDDEKRPNKKMPRQYKGFDSPFKSKF